MKLINNMSELKVGDKLRRTTWESCFYCIVKSLNGKTDFIADFYEREGEEWKLTHPIYEFQFITNIWGLLEPKKPLTFKNFFEAQQKVSSKQKI